MNQTFALQAACSSPPYPPALSTPAGAEREPDSRIWPGVLNGRVHGMRTTGRCGCQSARGKLCAGSLASGEPARAPAGSTTVPLAEAWYVFGHETRPHTAVSSPFRPGGGGKGLGDRGGIERQKSQHNPTQIHTKPKFNWNLTPISQTPMNGLIKKMELNPVHVDGREKQ